jgi:amino acid transporter
VALIAQGLTALGCVVLGQAGTSVKGAYEVLVSMSVISYMIPFLFLFASAIRAQRQPPGPEVVRLPGGRPALVVLGALGFLTTLAALVLAFVPAPDEPNKPLAVLKIAGLTAVMLGSGVAVFLLRRRQRCGIVPGP